MDIFVVANAEFSKFSRNYMELKKNLPIRPSEMGVLNIITQIPGPHTPVLLAELLSVSKPMITAHINVLTEKGYVIREQSPEDKRVFYIRPTQKALDLMEIAKADLIRQMGLLVDTLGQSGFDTLVRLVAQANGVLEAERKNRIKEDTFNGYE